MAIYVESTLLNQPNNEKLLRGDRYGNVCVTSPSDGIPKQYFLSTNGLGTGTINANGNYSGASPTDFYIEFPSNYEIHSLLVNISDNSNFNQSDYGGITAGTVTNGVKIFVYNKAANLEIPLLSSYAVTANYQWAVLTHDMTITSFAGLSQTLMANFMIVEDYGKPIIMEKGDKFIVRLQDNFTGLVSQTFGLRGILF